MTLEDFNEEFKRIDLHSIAKEYEQDGVPDKPARREAYNNKIDSYCKEGIITEKDGDNWCIPSSLETTLYWL